MFIKPYKNTGLNAIYNMLFCDDPLNFGNTDKQFEHKAQSLILSNSTKLEDLRNLLLDVNLDIRYQLLIYNKLIQLGEIPILHELLGIVIELGLDSGLDVLAAYKNGAVRYINQFEKLILWEALEENQINLLIQQLFHEGNKTFKNYDLQKLSRSSLPGVGVLRISLLRSDGTFYLEGSIDDLFSDSFTQPLLEVATYIMQILIDRSLNSSDRND